jgi:hypothetical protein
MRQTAIAAVAPMIVQVAPFALERPFGGPPPSAGQDLGADSQRTASSRAVAIVADFRTPQRATEPAVL